MANVSVIGMGYVGLPLALAFDAADYDVVGYDLDQRKIASFTDGIDTTGEVGHEAVEKCNVRFTSDPAEIRASGYYLITVPTPIDEIGRPDLSYVEAAGETVGDALTVDSTIVLESTVYPGATREVLIPVVERRSGLAAGREFFVGYSPERINPGRSEKRLSEIVKIVSGHDDVALERLCALYEDIVDAGIYPAPSMETAEAAKCLENIQRDVNIALMNEFAVGCHELDVPLDARDVIEAAATKWNFHEYRPGIVGGHCVPVDPNYLIWKLEQGEFTTKVMRAAREVNDGIASHIATVTTEALGERARFQDEQLGAVFANGGRMLSGHETSRPRMLVLGFAYKRHTTDVRSPVLEAAVDQLRDIVDLVGIDPLVPNETIQATFEVPVQDELDVEGFDALLLATPHDQFTSLDLETLSGEMNELPVLVDVTGTYDREQATENGFIYRGL